MFKALVAEFLAFLLSKSDEKYAELEKRIESLENERDILRMSIRKGDRIFGERLEDLEKKVFWERYIE